MTAPSLREVEAEEEVAACFPVMRLLRPGLGSADDLVRRVARQRRDGYRLLAAWAAGRPVGLAGYRLQENLVYGRFLYVDDLVSDAAWRGAGIATRLLDHLGEAARRDGCARLVLDTALDNAPARRFYGRRGLATTAIRFARRLDDG